MISSTRNIRKELFARYQRLLVIFNYFMFFQALIFPYNMSDKLLYSLNFGTKFQCEFIISCGNYNVAMATFRTVPKWRPDLKRIHLLSVICPS